MLAEPVTMVNSTSVAVEPKGPGLPMRRGPGDLLRRVWARRIGPYVASALLTSAVTVFALQLWRAHWSAPFVYSGDALSSAAYFKTVLETGWFEHQPRLGAPFGQFYFDFPFTDILHPLIIKFFGLFTGNWVTIFNGYYLLGYLLAGLTAVSFLLRCGLSRGLAVILAALYAITPYHFVRGESHYFLGEYWMVPLALNLVLAVALDQPLWGIRGLHGRWARIRGALTGRGAATVVVLVLIVLDGAYYGLFTAILLGLVAAIAAVSRRSWSTLTRVLPALATILVTFVAISLPDVIFAATHGGNPGSVVRSVSDSERYAGKLASLLLPDSSSRIPGLGALRAWYDGNYPISTEGATLGLLGAVGFLCLLLVPLVALGRASAPKPGPPVLGGTAVLAALALIAWTGFITSTVGGIGTLLSFFTDAIRGWNRMSIFLVLVSLAGFGVLVDRLLARAERRPGRLPVRAWRPLLLVLVLLTGFFDQTPPSGGVNDPALVASFESDGAFTTALEAKLPPSSMVFQLPYIGFPEGPNVHNENNADQLIPFLHSTSLRFNSGGMKGRPQIDWMGPMSRQPAKVLTRDLAVIGYAGIIVDRAGTGDNGAQVAAQLKPYTGPPELTSPNGRFLYFSLLPQITRVQAEMTPEARAAQARLLTNGATTSTFSS